METVQLIALTLGVGWASGINLYAAVFMLGLLGNGGYIELPPGLEPVMNPLVMAAAGFMYLVEFFADKTPGVDTAWDTLHTFIRIPAGAILAAGALGGESQALELVGYLVGGSAAAASHLTKAGSRVLINTSPEPVTNWVASITEDIAVIGGLWTALNHPWVFIVLFILFVLLLIWLLPKLWRGILALFRRIAGWFGSKPAAPADEATPGDTPIKHHDGKT